MSEPAEPADAERIASLAQIMDRHGLDEVSLTVGETTYALVRRTAQAFSAPPVYADAGMSSAPVQPTAGPNVKKVVAPLVGVFYRASSPGTAPFVESGDRVEVGQILCIVEAMKLMNEITSDFSGIVRRILPENGALVTKEEELFWIEP